MVEARSWNISPSLDYIRGVIAGRFNPAGKLPFALANSAEAIVRQAPDAPGYDEGDTLYPFGWGLSYTP